VILTQSPTIQHASQRMIVALVPSATQGQGYRIVIPRYHPGLYSIYYESLAIDPCKTTYPNYIPVP
jgi:hypothetical protein